MDDPRIPSYYRRSAELHRQAITSPPGAAADVAAALGPGLGDRTPPIVLPGASFRPERSTSVDQQGQADIAPGATATLINFNVPAGQKCIVNGIGFGADDEISLRFATWSMLINNDPSPAYGLNQANIGTLGYPAQIFQACANGDLVTINMTMNAAAVQTYHLVARLTAYFYIEVTGIR